MFELSAFAGHRGHSNRVAVANRAPLPELNLALPPFCCRDSRCLTDGSLGSGRGTTAKKTLEAPASVFFPSKNCPPPPPHTLSDTSCRSHVLGRPGTHLLRRVRALALVKTPARAVLAISHTTKTNKKNTFGVVTSVFVRRDSMFDNHRVPYRGHDDLSSQVSVYIEPCLAFPSHVKSSLDTSWSWSPPELELAVEEL